MLLDGRIDDSNQLWVTLTVAGEHSQSQIEALLDTGFTGEIQLPLQIAVPLGLKLAGVAPFRLADGELKHFMLFSASIHWGTKLRTVTATVVDTDTPLIGGGLLHGYVLVVDFDKRQLTIKEPHTDEPTVADTH